METHFEYLKIDVGLNHSAKVRISKEGNLHIFTVTYLRNDKESVDLSKHPELTENALIEIKRNLPDYEFVSTIRYGQNWEMYKFKKVL